MHRCRLSHRWMLTGLTILLLLVIPASSAAFSGHSGEIIVRYHEHARPGVQALDTPRRDGFGQMVRRLRAPDTVLVRPEGNEDFQRVLERYSNNPDVEYAEPNWMIERMASAPLPDDPAFDDSGLPGIWWICQQLANRLCEQRGNGDTRVSYAWEVWRQHQGATAPGSLDVTVAIIDTGIDVNHPDLQGNISADSRRIIRNDDTPPSDVTDTDGHGTHIAGIIGAVGDNAEGLAGINWRVTLLALKIFPDAEQSAGEGGPRPAATVADAVDAIYAAIDKGANIINASYGYGTPSTADQRALSAARDAGILVVAAAGNAGTDNDVSPIYPASYPLDNIISVAAGNTQGTFASYSNRGRNTVHLAAPGGTARNPIYSTLPTTLEDDPEIRTESAGEPYGTLAGTSMATPMVAGAAALALALEPDMPHRLLRERIVQSANVRATLSDHLIGPGLLDIEALVLSMVDANAPALDPMRPTRLEALPLSNGDIRLQWLDNSALNEAYRVERRLPDDGDWQPIGDLPANAESYTDTMPNDGETTTLRYRVLALKSGRNEDCCASDVVEVENGVRHYQQGSASMDSDSGCFIATAAFGTPMAAEIQTLREFRDQRLRRSAAGRWLIRRYEALSPPVAGYIAERPRLRAVVRGLLRPVIWLLG